MVPETMDGISGSGVQHEQKMTASSAVPSVSSSAALRQQLQQAQRALKRTRQHLQLQEARSRQLVTACAAKLRERQAETERSEALKERQFQRILQQLTVLQSRMQREQKQITARLTDQEQRAQQQARELERQRRANRRLLTKVHRLSQPCARCGAKPDSGISDCDEGEEVAAKVARRAELSETVTGMCSTELTPVAAPVSPVAKVAPVTPTTPTAAPSPKVSPAAPVSPATPKNAGGSPPAERGIIRTPGEPRPAMHKTVTFSLQDKENVPETVSRRPARPVRPVQPRPRPPPTALLQPCIISPPSVSINGTTYGGQPSIVETISQLLGADLEWPVVRRPTLVPKKLSVIPEGNESARDELSEPEYENVRVETLGQDADKEDSPKDGSGKRGKVETKSGKESLDNDDVQNRNYRNVPRSRSNINLIMSESEGVQIKDNFEEFKFDDDMASSVCSETASERSADNGHDEKHSFDRRAGDGAESEQNDAKVVINGNYEKFLELSGLSQKALAIPTSRFTSHRVMQKGKDAKHRQQIRMMFDGTTIEERSPTSSVRYYSEQL
ncbi:translation initiation factor IF-2-like [Amphibalanus amphitrite]|uniref:translation initiation factor IF-2-like n=1 Tax=Amphibalanus amphitrite TaxID=1232801 RepID=UPI001C90197D|nr:translation initiation factor IF-2-like [Amphibalanus amphitrite]